MEKHDEVVHADTKKMSKEEYDKLFHAATL